MVNNQSNQQRNLFADSADSEGASGGNESAKGELVSDGDSEERPNKKVEAAGESHEALPDSVTSEANELTLLALSSIQNVGFYTLRNLFNKLGGDLSKVWQLNNEELFETLRVMRTPQAAQVARRIHNDRQTLLTTAETQLRFLKGRYNTSILFRFSPTYPKKLERLKDAPAWLFVQGDTSLLHDEKVVAVVGTRVPTERGVETARAVTGELIKERCIILSGLAEGIDEVSHQTAVDYGAPTIAVLGHGLDVTFPAKTAGLRRELVERGGAVVSEYLIGDSYGREKFIQRNRIQAALSGAVAVIEAKSKSGTSHTVKFARALGVPLFGAVDGELQEISTHELLHDLQSAGDPVFDVGSKVGQDTLRLFIEKIFAGVKESERSFDYRLFSGVWREILRITNEYSASNEDIDWLISQMEGIRKERK